MTMSLTANVNVNCYSSERDELVHDFPADHLQDGHAAFRAEFGLARIAGIEEEHAVQHLRKWPVRVPKDDGVRLLLGKLVRDGLGQRPRVDNVVDEKFLLRERDDFRELERQAGIHVALHDGDGRDELQFQTEREGFTGKSGLGLLGCRIAR